MKIRYRIFLFVIPLAILPLLLLGIFSNSSLNKGFQEQAILQDQQLCLIAATQIEQILDECYRNLLLLTSQLSNQFYETKNQSIENIIADENNPIKQTARELSLRYSPFLKIRFLAPNGEEKFSTSGLEDETVLGSAVQESNFLKAVAIAGGFPPSPIQLQPTEGKLVTTFSINLQFDQTLLGFIFIELNLQAISIILEQLVQTSQISYFLFDGSGKILVNSPNNKIYHETFENKFDSIINQTAKKLSTSFEFTSFTFDKKNYFFSSRPVKEYIAFKEPIPEERWFIGILRTETPLFSKFRQTQFIFLILLVLGLGIAIIGTFFISKRITKPIDELTFATRRFSTGKLESKIPISSGGEIGDLANDFNKMAADLQKLIQEVDIHKNLSAIGQFAAGMYHDLKSPLEGIKLLASGMKRKVGDDDPLKKYVDEILIGVENLDYLIYETLDFVKPQALNLTNVDLNNFLQEIVKEIKIGKGRFKFSLSNKVQTVQIDPIQLKHVFLNLINNAIDAISENGEITISSEVEFEKIKIEIKDTGSGIKKDDLEHIFQPFYSTKKKGHGLGLSISHQIIKNHEGEIKIDSEYGKWTKVIVWLKK
jgi:signal transduction histidine kinase